MRTSSQCSVAGKISSLQQDALLQNGGEPPKDTSSDVPDTELTYSQAAVVIIERRAFIRACVQSILSNATELNGAGVATVEEYLQSAGALKAAIIVLCAIGVSAREADAQLKRLQDAGCTVPIVVMSDSEDTELVMSVIDRGANGFMPADISLEVAAHALRLVAAGGQYFPAGRLLAARKMMDEPYSSVSGPKGMFTRRQVAVIDALRKGKANKIIAYELNMCESTVKVHVRNIMKKLNARNRTEVAYLANELLQEHRL